MPIASSSHPITLSGRRVAINSPASGNNRSITPLTMVSRKSTSGSPIVLPRETFRVSHSSPSAVSHRTTTTANTAEATPACGGRTDLHILPAPAFRERYGA